MRKPTPSPVSTRRRLVVPVVLAVTLASGAVAGLATISGCGDDDPPRVDASIGDAGPDTPII